jgi:hypothetical protein
MSHRHRIKDRTERTLRVVKAFSVAVPSGVQLKLDVEAASGIADSGDHEQDLTDLLREIGEVAQTTGAGALFLIDEMHNLLMSNGRAQQRVDFWETITRGSRMSARSPGHLAGWTSTGLNDGSACRS